MARRSIPLPCLTDELNRRMEPVAVKRPERWPEALWACAGFFTGIGVGLAWIVIVALLPVIWAVRKMRRAKRWQA